MITKRLYKTRRQGRAIAVTIPGEICDELCIRPGDFLLFARRADEFCARRVDTREMWRMLKRDGGKDEE